MLTVLTLGFSGVTQAATYQYVNASGSLSSVTADSASEALATAFNLGSHSGVMLVTGTPVTQTVQAQATTQTTGSSQYLYVNNQGTVSSVNANSSVEAFAKAFNISPHSGVLRVS